MTKITYLDIRVFIFSHDSIISHLECGHTELEAPAEPEIARLCQRFQNDGNGSRRYNTSRLRITTLNEDRYLWHLLPKEVDG
ncbi:hypothetical protein TNCV_3046441 [Trichonephila clavipes]|uniref:Uncharacterized protein n=1 Tax=Trichonephila clavipes TaxID=2585209 RepID=A0A8X6V4S6_TRICX|nr:hypothetical protein TNCV_3046441 [Trichonephila clavipes]